MIPSPASLLIPPGNFYESEYWYFINCTSLKDGEGWKFYIPLSLNHAGAIIRTVALYLYGNQVAFKYIKNTETLKIINSGVGGYTQIGKNIVIYLNPPDEGFLRDLSSLLSNFSKDYPIPPHANRLFNGERIFYRFGSYRSSYNLQDKDQFLDRINFDDKKIFFSDIKTEKEFTNVDQMLLDYPVIECISQRGKGGVFLALNIKSEFYSEVILKIAYIHGEENEYGVDGVQLLKNEETALKKINEHNDACVDMKLKIASPTLLRTEFSNECYAIALNKIEGRNGLFIPRDKEGIFIFNNTVKEIKKLHKIGISWGDAKIGNILSNGSNISLLDFENSSINSELHSFPTFIIKDLPTGISSIHADIIHFCISVLFTPETDDQKNISLKIIIDKDYPDNLRLYVAEWLMFFLKFRNATIISSLRS
ncbi:TPA: hypothetical protein ACGQTX_002950 [Raoultella ornithinolytica]